VDGFTFLRLLMARRPTPVVVLSAASRPTDAFKALELGALDFVTRPERGRLAPIRDLLLERCGTARLLRTQNLARVLAPDEAVAVTPTLVEPPRVGVVGASTGGPQALLRLLLALPRDVPLGLAIAQHMPERFTATFAERLARRTAFAVQEAVDGDVVASGRVLLAPGGRHLELLRDAAGVLRVAVFPGDGDSRRHCPSVDRLFASAARLLGPRACAVLLTGMGTDGRAGAVAVKRAGGLVLAESEETALVFGMPQAAAEAGAVDELLPLGRIAARLARFARNP
jgi:two-component system chemotaxis response regulator CheB